MSTLAMIRAVMLVAVLACPVWSEDKRSDKRGTGSATSYTHVSLGVPIAKDLAVVRSGYQVDGVESSASQGYPSLYSRGASPYPSPASPGHHGYHPVVLARLLFQPAYNPGPAGWVRRPQTSSSFPNHGSPSFPGHYSSLNLQPARALGILPQTQGLYTHPYNPAQPYKYQ